MHRKGILLAVAAMPLLLLALPSGPIAHVTAVPGTGEPSCSQARCHLTNTPVNGGGGSVTISFPNGPSYQPGVKQRLTVTVVDSAARIYGFQMTARSASDLAGTPAGTFTPIDRSQRVLCAAADLSDQGTERTGATCPASMPLEFIEHTEPYSSNVFNVDWTPPSSNIGPVGVYISVNGAPGDSGFPVGHIYTVGYTLQPPAGPPSITSIRTPTDFGGGLNGAPGAWLEIKGSNLAATSRTWKAADFSGSAAPTALDGSSVRINGKAAFVSYISPGQLNVQAPDDATLGPVNVVVSNANGDSSPAPLTLAGAVPGLLAPAAFKVSGTQYLAALFQDGTFVGTAGFIGGIGSRPARPGDVITLYGVGFGPVTPPVAAGTIAPAGTSLAGNLTVSFGDVPARALFQGLAPGAVGLYQFNVVVPSVPAGDVRVSFRLNGQAAIPDGFLTVGQ